MHENVFLVSANDEAEAMVVVEALAVEYEQVGDDSQLEVDGVAAEYRFAGIRKLISVASDAEVGVGLVGTGVEVTYSVFEVGSLADIERLVAGESVSVLYRE